MGLAVTKVSSRRRGPMKDPSVRKRAKPALSKEYQVVFEKTGKAMVIVEEDATISLVNAEFEKLSGFTKKEIEGKKNWTEFVARDDRKRVKEYHLLRRTDPMLAPRSYEFRFLDRQEKVKNIILTIGQIPGTNKSMASLLDVTDRRQAEIAQNNSNGQEGGVQVHVKELEKANEALQAEIADLKREVERLRESEERNRTLIDNIDLAINLIDADHNIVMVNAAGTKQTNKPVSELIGKKCFREFEKRNAVCPHCPGVQTMATGKLAEVETEGVRDDGSHYNVRIQTFPVFGHDGTATGFIEIGEDITERKQTEVLLQQEKETFFTILQNALYGVGLSDSDGSYIYVNPEFTKITGYTLEDIPTGRDWMHKAYPDKEYRQKVIETWKKDIGVGGISRVFSVVCKDGETKEIEFRPTQLDDGRNVVMLADITEHKHAEELLQEEREIFFSILHKAPYGVLLIDNDGKCLYLNPEFMNTTGYTAADIPTAKDWMYKAYPDKEYRQKVFETWKHEIIHKEAHKVFRVQCKDGMAKNFEFRATRLGDGRVIVMSSDVTEREQAAEALRESEERYRSLVDNIKFGINLIDTDHNIVMVNTAQSKYFKKPVLELIGKKCFREFEQRNTVCPHCPGIQAMATGKPAEVEHTSLRKDTQGHYFCMRLHAFPIFKEDGTATGFIEVAEDITERKQMEQELRASEDRFRNLVERMKVGLSSIDEKGVLTYANEQFCTILGYSMDEVIGRPTVDFYYDEETRKSQEEVFAKRKKGMRDPTPYEIAWKTKDGRKVYTILSPTPSFDADGRYIGSAAIQTDITERKQMEEALKKSQQELQTLMDASPIGICWADMHGNIQYNNRKFHELFGYTVEDIPNIAEWRRQAYPDPFYREQIPSLVVLLTEAQKQGKEADPLEVVVMCKDGTIRHVMQAGAFVSNRILAIYSDITDRKRAEDQLKRYAAELEHSNEEVKNFAYIVSHDLRVPLVNLKGYTSELHSALEVVGPAMETALPHLNEDKRSALAMALHEDVPEALEFITNSVSRMDSFINSVLILSRLGRRELKPESIDMNTLVKTSLENLSHQIQERGIDVTVASLPEVVADRTAMEQIMGNILGNAVKYLDSERPGQIEVTAQTNNGEQVFCIRDNGRGIAQEDMHKVFAPFRRAGKQDTQGEGMGLAYVQTLVRRHNGRIWCESEPGKGTTFTFSISQHRTEGEEHVAH
jgi:PAS domain S-box-containing protein